MHILILILILILIPTRISSKESEEFYKAYPELKKNNNNDDSHFNYKLPTNFEEPSLSSQEESPVQVAVRKRRYYHHQYQYDCF